MVRPKNRLPETYLVTDEITPVDPKEIDALEAKLGSLPLGYREYLTRFGAVGRYNDNLYVNHPQHVQSLQSKGYDWDLLAEGDEGSELTEDDFPSLLLFGGSEHGDRVIYCPRFAGALFVRYRNTRDEKLKFEGGLLDPLQLLIPDQTDKAFRFFESGNEYGKPPRRGSGWGTYQTPWSVKKVAAYIIDYWGKAEVVKATMPEAQYGGEYYYIFVKRVGGRIGVSNDDADEESRAIRWSYDLKWKDEMDRFEAELAEAVPELY